MGIMMVEVGAANRYMTILFFIVLLIIIISIFLCRSLRDTGIQRLPGYTALYRRTGRWQQKSHWPVRDDPAHNHSASIFWCPQESGCVFFFSSRKISLLSTAICRFLPDE